MPKHSKIKLATIPVTVPFSADENLTLHVFNQRGTTEDKKKLNNLLEQAANALQSKVTNRSKLENERKELLSKTVALGEERQKAFAEFEALEPDSPQFAESRAAVEALDTQIIEERKAIEKPLEALRKKIRAVEDEGEQALHDAYARQLEFFVESTDITDDDEKPIPPSFEFFRNEVSFNLLESCVSAVADALKSPLVMPGFGAS